MKIIKRDGRAVDYDPSKIVNAIGKANQEVSEDQRAIETDIHQCIKCCACVKCCPNEARKFSTPFAAILHEKFSARRQPELFF